MPARHYLVKFYLHNKPEQLAFIVPFSGIENRVQGNEGSFASSQCKRVEELAFEMTSNPLLGPVPHFRKRIHSGWFFVLRRHLQH